MIPILSPLGDLDEKTSHNWFIADALNKLFSSYSTNSQKAASYNLFINENINQINKIRRVMQFNPKFLSNDGTDGVVYVVGDNMILKIFKDKFSFDQAKITIERLHKNPDLAKTEPMIYDADIIGNFKGQNIYYYIMEKMKPVISFGENSKIIKNLSKINRAIGISILNHREKWDYLKRNDFSSNETKNEISYEAGEIFDSISITYKNIISTIENDLNLKSSWLSSLIREMILNYLTGRGDMHLGNLGITNYGELRYFDATHSDWKQGINFEMEESI